MKNKIATVLLDFDKCLLKKRQFFLALELFFQRCKTCKFKYKILTTYERNETFLFPRDRLIGHL